MMGLAMEKQKEQIIIFSNDQSILMIAMHRNNRPVMCYYCTTLFETSSHMKVVFKHCSHGRKFPVVHQVYKRRTVQLSLCFNRLGDPCHLQLHVSYQYLRVTLLVDLCNHNTSATRTYIVQSPQISMNTNPRRYQAVRPDQLL